MIEISKSLYKTISKPIVRFFVWVRIGANEVTLYSMIVMALAGYYFITRDYWLALLLCGISALLDYIDGDVAKATTGYTPVGAWIDSFGDIVKQNGIMGCIAIGIHAPAGLIVTFFVTNAALNVISFHYNNTFGFDSYNGSALFRKYMDMKPTMLNRLFKNIIDPTSSWTGLWFGTVRYWIIAGVVFDRMALIFLIITVTNIFKAVFMFTIYALHLAEYKKLWLSQALAILDKERTEYYDIRQK